MYPNQLELVWFDKKDPTNSAYAAWVAAHAVLDDNFMCTHTLPKAGGELDALCSEKPLTAPHLRENAVVVLPTAQSTDNCTTDACGQPILFIGGGGGCSIPGGLGQDGSVSALLLALAAAARRRTRA